MGKKAVARQTITLAAIAQWNTRSGKACLSIESGDI
jgi:hypothetical protein